MTDVEDEDDSGVPARVTNDRPRPHIGNHHHAGERCAEGAGCNQNALARGIRKPSPQRAAEQVGEAGEEQQQSEGAGAAAGVAVGQDDVERGYQGGADEEAAGDQEMAQLVIGDHQPHARQRLFETIASAAGGAGLFGNPGVDQRRAHPQSAGEDQQAAHKFGVIPRDHIEEEQRAEQQGGRAGSGGRDAGDAAAPGLGHGLAEHVLAGDGADPACETEGSQQREDHVAGRGPLEQEAGNAHGGHARSLGEAAEGPEQLALRIGPQLAGDGQLRQQRQRLPYRH